MFGHHMYNKYVLVKKNTLVLAALGAACLVGMHYYRYHKADMKKDVEGFIDDTADLAKQGKEKAKEVAKG